MEIVTHQHSDYASVNETKNNNKDLRYEKNNIYSHFRLHHILHRQFAALIIKKQSDYGIVWKFKHKNKKYEVHYCFNIRSFLVYILR